MEKRLEKDKRQFRCMWGFHHFHRSTRNHKLLSNGRILHKNANGKLQPRELRVIGKHDDEEFYKRHDRAESKALTVFSGDKKIKNRIQKEKPSEKKKKSRVMASSEKHPKDDIGLFDHLIEKYKAERNASQNTLQFDHLIEKYKAERNATRNEMLYSNKDMFLKFLRDPNSVLQNLQHGEMENETIKSFLNRKLSDHQSNETSRAKTNQHRFSSDPQHSNKIVVLKPIPRRVCYSENVACNCSHSVSHQSSSGKRKNVKRKSFSLAEIKRKLKCAMREKWKEQQWLSMNSTSGKLDCNIRTMRIGDEENKANKLQESANEPETSCMTETVRKKLNFSKQQEFDIFLEAKRHLLERLINTNEDESLKSSRAKTLARILDSPERDFWASQSPKGMRYSTLEYHRVANKTCSQIWEGKEKVFSSSQSENEEVSSCSRFGRLYYEQEASSSSSGTSEQRVQNATTVSFNKAHPKSNGHKYVAETNEVKHPPDTQTSEPTQMKNEDTTKIDPAFFSQCSILDSPSKSPRLGSSSDVSSSSPFSISKLDVSDDVKDKKEHPSPVSVLDLSFTEDVDSPTSLAEQPREMSLQPRCINFEEYSQEDSPLSDRDTICSYIESALQALHWKWEELWVNSPLTEHVVRASLFTGLELSSRDMHCNPELLLDYIDEVLLETYQCYYGWLSFPRRPTLELMLDKVMKEVNDNLCPIKEQPTLDWLVEKDLAKPGSWLDIRIDSTAIMNLIADEILEESITEILV